MLTAVHIRQIAMAGLALAGALLPAVGHAAEPLPGRAVFPSPATAPQSWRSSMLGMVSYLPPVAPPGTRAADAAQLQPLKLRAGTDLPAVGWQSGADWPRPYLAPATPLGYAVSPKARSLVPPLRPSDPDGPRADTAGEPSLSYYPPRPILPEIPPAKPTGK